ncbi:MAG: hypothetical protein ACRDDO_02260 [Plesiomonas shigelloides]
MKPRQKRRARRTQPVVAPSELAALRRISQQLEQLTAPTPEPLVLHEINGKLDRIELQLAAVRSDATRRGAMAGALAGGLTSGIITTGILLIKARLGL